MRLMFALVAVERCSVLSLHRIDFSVVKSRKLYRGSVSAHVSLNLLNELGKRDKMRGLPSVSSQALYH